LSQTDILAICEHLLASNEEETALVMPPPITENHDKEIFILYSKYIQIVPKLQNNF